MMKKSVLALPLLLAAAIPAGAQSDVTGDVYNDSTEYIVVQQMVTDTAAIKTLAAPYKKEWASTLDSLKRMETVVKHIHEHQGKNLPEELVPDYKMFLTWLQKERCTDGNRYIFSDGHYMIIDFEKAAQQTEKRKIPKQIAELSKRIRFGQTSSLEYYLKLDDIDVYKRFVSYELPQKPTDVSIRNPRYRPDAFMKARNENSNYITGDLARLEYYTLNRGWEWLQQGNWNEHKETYPLQYYYKTYAEHPEYKVIDIGTNSLKQVCNEAGTLVYTSGPYRSSYGEVNDLIKHLILLMCRQDYEANKYDVKKEGPEVQYAIRYGLGYFSEEAKKAKSPYKLFNATASKYIEQLQSDHRQDFKYLYEIRRIGQTAFLYRFVTYEMQPKMDVYVSYFNTAPFLIGKQIDRIVSY